MLNGKGIKGFEHEGIALVADDRAQPAVFIRRKRAVFDVLGEIGSDLGRE